MKKITILLMMAICFAGFSQDLLQDFENGGLGGPFGGAAAVLEPDPEANGTRGQVAKLNAFASGQFFQGINIALDQNVELINDLTMTLDVYSLSPITIAPKVVAGVSGAPDSTAAVSHTGSGWETLTVTFNEGLDNTVTANGVYTAFVIYYNWDSTTTDFIRPPIDREFFVDNISGLAVAPATPNPPTVAAPTPTAAPDNQIISLYSDEFAQQPLNFDAGFCGTNSTTEFQVQGNNTILYNNNACQGIQLINPVDASSFTTLNFDFYIDDQVTDFVGKVVSLKLVDTNGPDPDDFIDIVLTDASTPTLISGQWVTLSTPVDLSLFGTFDEFVITAGTLSGQFYYDNVYLSGGLLSNDDITEIDFTVSPNPTANTWNIQSTNTIDNVQIFDITGKQVLNIKGGSSNLSINGTALNSGVYLAKVNGNNSSKTVKLIRL
ncbi:MAG: T9SS type A sorting domain-containing protein [Nonlabens sp.]